MTDLELWKEIVRATQGIAMSDVSKGPVAVCATFEGERHELGLHMAAVALAVAGWRIRFLGADTPFDSIVAAATGADAVVVGASEATDVEGFRAHLRRLRRAIPGTPVFAGGIDPPPGEDRAVWPGTLPGLIEASAAVAVGSTR